MAKTFAKVTQKIQKKKKLLHPKGRKAQLLARASLRDERVNKKKLLHSMRKSEENLIIDFFQEFINSPSQIEKTSFELDDIKDLIKTFIERDNDELEKLKAERRADRPTSKRQDALENRLQQETHYFLTGWKVPDLRTDENVSRLRSWTGGHGGLTAIKFCIVKKEGTPEDGKDVEMS
ncbi:hypothetical protein C6P40_004287 [Pichia californica]|uniref:Translation machinery-associated protein 16 n=1 Tax=Pichia californica TaxID=460514 RepID=A0A9P6WMM6_9ASCO|nr:hypothetical protein C6P42_003788 [[Candida] californica]KAG0689877.1 hypothetical protein C6P40_004287 [[Candida] californica]